MSAPACICLVDDDLFIRDALALGLRDLGFTVRAAPGAAAGLDLVEREGVDALVTDLCMPGTSGSQLISQARARWPALPIIAISGASEIGGINVSKAARGLGADALLAKPFRAAELAAVLHDVLARKARTAGGPNPSE